MYWDWGHCCRAVRGRTSTQPLCGQNCTPVGTLLDQGSMELPTTQGNVTWGSFHHQGAHTLQKSARGGVFLRCKCLTHHLSTGQQWARGGVFLRKCKCVTHHLHIGQKWARVRRCKCLTHHLGTGQRWVREGVFLRRCKCVNTTWVQAISGQAERYFWESRCVTHHLGIGQGEGYFWGSVTA